MADPRVNLLTAEAPAGSPSEPPQPPRRRRAVLLVGVVFFVAVATLLFTNVVVPSVRLSYSFGGAGFWKTLAHLTFSTDRELVGEADDRINLLIMGIGGAGHDGPLLTDTIMLVSIQPSSKRVAFTSIPRDLSIPYPDGSWRRINEAYNLGESLQAGRGGEYAANTIGAVFGTHLPYFVVVDFSGFRKAIDELGGIQVYVDRSFTDSTFPNENEDGGLHTVSFTGGWQWMDGVRALDFARSRHGNNGEGSDFARARRQQKILLAIKDRLLASSVLLNPFTINQLVSDLETHVRTNLEPWEMVSLYRLAGHSANDQVVRASFDDSPNGLLVDTRGADGAFLLAPKNGDFDALQRVVQNIFSTEPAPMALARVEVQNGTNLPGLAATLAKRLEAQGFTVSRIRNADARPIDRTTIYDLTNGGKPDALTALRALIKADVAATLPTWLAPSATSLDPTSSQTTSALPSDADFVIIIGTDNASLSARPPPAERRAMLSRARPNTYP